jgi:V-type H+-transporting ATPase subunit a
MTYVSIILSEEVAPACIKELGNLGCIQFVDLSPDLTPFQRRYVSYVRKCDEIERKIRFISNEVTKLGISIKPAAASIEDFILRVSDGSDSSSAYVLDMLDKRSSEQEKALLDLCKFGNQLADEYAKKVEFSHILRKVKDYTNKHSDSKATLAALNSDGNDEESAEVGLSMNPLHPKKSTSTASLASLASNSSLVSLVGKEESWQVQCMAGCVLTTEKVRFQRMIYRATRKNVYLRFAPLNLKAVDFNGNYIPKNAFIAFYKSKAVEAKLQRICDAFNVNRYNISNFRDVNSLESQINSTFTELEECKKVLETNKVSRSKICNDASLYLEEMLWLVRKEKSVYHTLNLFKADVAGNSVLRGRGWILTSAARTAFRALRKAHKTMNLPYTTVMQKVEGEHWPKPPTHFITNKYTDAFQQFVNTYGIPRYKEANPALFTAATFPFLFGVMYGDIGHGSVLALFGLFLILTEAYGESRACTGMLKSIYSARFMLFAMGCMGVYAGLIYNDYFSIGLRLFTPTYTFNSNLEGSVARNTGVAYGDPNGVYTFGVDPIWKLSTNELLFFNSMKMKMSVILGIFQMTFGVILRGLNAIFFKNWLDFTTEFLPMIIFDVGLFGYMVVLIFVKWSINWNLRMAQGSCSYDSYGNIGRCDPTVSSCYNINGVVCDSNSLLTDVCPLDMGGTGDGCQPPNLITTLINIALAPGYVTEPMYAGQASIQTIILLVAFMCVPWLLGAKPFILWLRSKKAAKHTTVTTHDEEAHKVTAAPSHDDHGHGDGEFQFGEVFIHQAIETIEFVLGMVSNTASYLRLWALSLAHTELATVFWEKAMLAGINTANPVAIFIGYSIFAAVTFAVLLAMDVLECFLHALRLHWVEFQNKFFKADGYSFQPFHFKEVLENASLAEGMSD